MSALVEQSDAPLVSISQNLRLWSLEEVLPTTIVGHSDGSATPEESHSSPPSSPSAPSITISREPEEQGNATPRSLLLQPALQDANLQLQEYLTSPEFGRIHRALSPHLRPMVARQCEDKLTEYRYVSACVA